MQPATCLKLGKLFSLTYLYAIISDANPPALEENLITKKKDLYMDENQCEFGIFSTDETLQNQNCLVEKMKRK